MRQPSDLTRMAAEFNEHPNSSGHDATAALCPMLLEEEHDEAQEAFELGDRAKIARELADVVYVAFTTAWAHRIDLDAAVDEIHRAAMSKMETNAGREDGKIVKHPGFVPPDMTAAVRNAEITREAFGHRGGGALTLDEAIVLATKAHAGQVDKAGQPYIFHPLRVMLAVTERARVVALLHDVIEDTDYDHALLDPPRLTVDEWAALWLVTRNDVETYDQFIGRIANAEGLAGEIAREIKRADLLDNLRRVDDPEIGERMVMLRKRYERALKRLDET